MRGWPAKASRRDRRPPPVRQPQNLSKIADGSSSFPFGARNFNLGEVRQHEQHPAFNQSPYGFVVKTFGVVNPATGEVFAEAPECSTEQLDEVMASAAAAQRGW